MVKVVKDFSCRSAKHCPNNSKCLCNSLLQRLYKPTDFFLRTEFQALILIRNTKGVGIDIPWTIQAIEEVEMVRSKDSVDQYSSVLVIFITSKYLVNVRIGTSRTYNDLFPFQSLFPDMLSRFLCIFMLSCLHLAQGRVTSLMLSWMLTCGQDVAATGRTLGSSTSLSQLLPSVTLMDRSVLRRCFRLFLFLLLRIIVPLVFGIAVYYPIRSECADQVRTGIDSTLWMQPYWKHLL